MSDMMTFPDTWEEFEKLYGFNDAEEIYTNNSRLIPSFRVKQWLDHIAQKETKQQAIKASDLISRQAAIDALDKRFDSVPMEQTTEILMLRKDLRELPSAHPRKGKWIYGEHDVAMCDGYRCNKCGADFRALGMIER